MNIVQLPDPVLRKTAAPVTALTPKIIALICGMVSTLKAQDDPPGVGLAAPQVGVSLQIFLVMPPLPAIAFAKAGSQSSPPLKGEGQGEVAYRNNHPQPSIELFINPKILSTKGIYKEEDKNNSTLEGCLSLHKYYGPVDRANEVKIEYQTFDLKSLCNPGPSIQPRELPSPVTKTFTGFPAVIIQHEFDHLQGKMFIDRILEQKQKLYKISRDAKNKEILEEVEI